MEERGTLWFAYIFVIEFIVVVLLYMVAVVITKCFMRQMDTEHKDSVNNNETTTDLLKRKLIVYMLSVILLNCLQC